MKQALLAFDTDRIKDYVFATASLKEIRGGSHILEGLNRDEMAHLVGGACYYAFGGGGLFVVPEDEASMAIERVANAYAEKTGGAATITGVPLALPEGFDIERDDIKSHWKHLGDKLRAAKLRNPAYRTSVSHPLLHVGHTDGAFYATQPGEEQELISTPSYLKRQRNTEIRKQEERPDDFADIAVSNGYMALIYADGDRLGEALEICDTLPQIQKVACTLDEIVSSAKQSAVARQSLGSHQYDTLLQGGDDLILAVPAIDAFDLALNLADTFQDTTTCRLAKPHTLSTAIIWTHPNFPVDAGLHIAESVLNFAKLDGARRGLSGLVNFLVISSSNHLDFHALYHQNLVTEISAEQEMVRTLRAYSRSDLRELASYRHTLRRMSRSTLETLRQATYLPLSRAIFEALRTFVHWRDNTTRRALQHMVEDLVTRRTGASGRLMFPFVKLSEAEAGSEDRISTYYTPILDLAELWDFLPGAPYEA